MLIMHHHTTLDIPIIESEKNTAHENLLEKSALVNYSRGSNQNNLNFMPFHQCFHVVQLRRKFSLRLNEYLIQ